VGDDEPLPTRPTTTLGGVVRDNQPSFFPKSNHETNPLFRSGKQRRRWKKRPSGFATDEEGEEGEEGENLLDSKEPDSPAGDPGPSGEPREDDADMQTAGEVEGREGREDPDPADETMKE
jgi:hypothetical protein